MWPLSTSAESRDRRIFLIATGVGNESESTVKHFALWFEEELVRVKLNHVAIGESAVHVTSTWQLLEMALPLPLRSERGRVLEVLTEALTVYRVNGLTVPVRSHQAIFGF